MEQEDREHFDPETYNPGIDDTPYEFIRQPGHKVYWAYKPYDIGAFLISFDKKHVYNVYRDVPDKLTEKELRIFYEEYPFWREFCGG